MAAGEIVLYVDTGHLSDMAKARVLGTPAPGALDLCALLLDLVSKDRLVCPFSLWHVAELTRYENGPVRDEAARLLGTLSRARSFRYPWDIFDDEVLRALAPGLCSEVISIGAPSAFVPQEGASLDLVLNPGMAASNAGEVLLTIVEGMRSDGMIAKVTGFSASVFAADVALASERAADPKTRAQAVRMEVTDLMRNPEVRRAVQAAARVAGKSADPIYRLGTSGALLDAGLRGYASLVEFLARRSTDPGRKPRQSDPMDIGHLTLLPYCDAMLTERSAASIARPVGAILGVDVFAKREELVAWLRIRV